MLGLRVAELIIKSQSQVDEINMALASNVTKLVERDGKISELSARAERLENNSEMFQVMSDSDLLSLTLLSFVQKTARKLKRKEMMKSIPIPLLLLSILLVIILAVTVIVLTLSAKK